MSTIAFASHSLMLRARSCRVLAMLAVLAIHGAAWADRATTNNNVQASCQQSCEGEELVPENSLPMSCGETVGCGEAVCGCSCEPSSGNGWTAGFEATVLQPRFSSNIAFTRMEADGATFETFTDTEFDYGLEFSPRVFVGYEACGGLGFRATWWQFNHNPDALSTQPPANGFGDVTTPPFGDIDISSNIPTDTMSAASGLNAYTIDLEATQSKSVGCWSLGVAGGLRYASAEQTYLAQLRNTNDVLRGEIDYRHSTSGIGPTISLAAQRPIACNVHWFVRGRGSLLFGDTKTNLHGGEDLDLENPFTTTKNTSSDSLLSIGEAQIGLGWQAASCNGQCWQPFARVALEGQIWNGPGNATTPEGNFGFVGLNAAIGTLW